MKFSSLGLAPELQRAIDECGYIDMTPVQEQAIVEARRGRDILASAQTGTGKTAAFALPLLQKMCDKPLQMNAGEVRALILTPTRELAEQLGNTISRYAQFLPLRVNALYGGGRTSSQESKLKAGSDILISTPGRLLEHVLQCNVNLSKVEFLVLDEADRMLDMGFIADVQGLLQQAPEKRQTLLFSATVSGAVEQLAHKMLKRHITIKAAKLNTTADTVEHLVFPVEERRKAELFIELLREQNWFHVLVFTSTKDQADRLLKALKTEKLDVAVCHGDKTQGTRRRAIADFKSGKLQVLIATEVAARGLDIQGLEQVVNFNLPYLAEDYVHRIGRTGRAGQKGEAISFVSREEERALENIERLIGERIDRISLPGFEVSNRDRLHKNLSESTSRRRSNKASRTQISTDDSRSESKAGTFKPASKIKTIKGKAKKGRGKKK